MRTDGRTDRYGETSSCLLQILNEDLVKTRDDSKMAKSWCWLLKLLQQQNE